MLVLLKLWEQRESREENNLRESKNNIRDYFNDDIKESDYDNEENDIEDNAEANIADGMEESFSYLRDREFPEEILLELREYLLTSSNARFFQSKDVIREEVEKYFGVTFFESVYEQENVFSSRSTPKDLSRALYRLLN